MKNTLLWLALTFVSINGMAQSLPRLVSQFDSTGSSLMVYDSINYYYTGNRTNFDSCLKRYYTFSYPNGTPILRTDQLFDGNDNLIQTSGCGDQSVNSGACYRNTYSYDNNHRKITSLEESYNGSVWSYTLKDSLVYDTNGNIAEEFLDKAGGNITHSSYVYDPSNNLTASIIMQYDAASLQWDSSGKENYTYNANGKLLTYMLYSYAQGSGWQHSLSDTNFYIGNNVAVHKRYQETGGFPYDIIRLDSSSYNGSNDRIVFISYLIPIKYAQRVNAVFDNAHHITERILQTQTYSGGVGTGWWNYTRQLSTFNSFGLIHTASNEVWDGSNWAPADVSAKPPYKQRFHYEREDLAVGSLKAQNIEISISPNPATSFLTLDINWKQPEKVTIMICDMNGNIKLQWTENALNSLHRTIPLSSFEAGNFLLYVVGQTSKQTEKFTVVR